jgi:hypothetical protein
MIGQAAGASATAGSGTNLPCATIGQMVVDPATSHVFVSCPTTNSVSVLDYSGDVVGTIGGIAGASGLVDVGGTVYVTAENAGTVESINTTTLAAEPIGATGLVQAADLVFAGGYLWSTSSQEDCSAQAPLYRIDPSTGSVTTFSSVLGVFVDALIPDPGNPNGFFASTTCVTASSGQTVTISAGTPTAGPYTTVSEAFNGLMASSPDGGTVYASSEDLSLLALNGSTLSSTGVTYPANAPGQIEATATSAGDGGVLAFASATLFVYRAGDPSDLIGSTAWNQGQDVEPNGLAFNPDGSLLFAVTSTPTNSGEQPAQFHVLQTNALPAPAPFVTSRFPSNNFGSVNVGSAESYDDILSNAGPGNEIITGASFSGADPDDFLVDPSQCNPAANGVITLPPDGSCDLVVYFFPGALGSRSATMTLGDNESTPPSESLFGEGVEGYYEAGANGSVAHFGDAESQGDMAGKPLAAPIVSMALTPDGGGYWLLGRDGGIFSFGDARFYGSTGGLHLNQPVEAMTSTSDGGGYWFVAADGGIFAFGDAPFYGSTGAIHLNKPIVGMAATSDGGGYWLVASDGGIFAFGDAQFYGSTGAIHLNKPIVGMASTPDGAGYWLVASDGGVFNFGDAPFYGSAASSSGQSIVGLVSAGSPTVQAILDVPALRQHLSHYPSWSGAGG